MKSNYMDRIALFSFFLLAGCCGPANWAETLSTQVKCGMSIAAVQALSHETFIEMEVPAGWKTHYFRNNETDVSFGFVNGKLRYIQVSWNQKMMRTASYQKIDLCTNTMMIE